MAAPTAVGFTLGFLDPPPHPPQLVRQYERTTNAAFLQKMMQKWSVSFPLLMDDILSFRPLDGTKPPTKGLYVLSVGSEPVFCRINHFLQSHCGPKPFFKMEIGSF